MSGYSFGYGQWPLPQAQPPPPPFQPPQAPAQQLQQQYAPFSYPPTSNTPPVYGTNNPYQTAPQYPPQSYPQAPLPNPNYYGASQAAFEYNAHVAASGTSTAWTHGSVSTPAPPQPSTKEQEIPASGSFQELFQSNRASPRPQQQESESFYQPSPAPPVPRPLLSTAESAPNKRSQHKNAEEGELEEGELSEDYDDMYDPQMVSTSGLPGEDNSASNPAQQHDESEGDSKRASLESPVAIYSTGVAGDPPSRDASVIDPQDDAFYDEDDEDAQGGTTTNGQGQSGTDVADADDEYMGFSDSEQRTPPPDQSEEHRAESYSPHLSPEATRSALPSAKTDGTAPVEAPAEKAVVNSEKLANGSAEKNQSSSNVERASSANQLPFSSVEEAKKEAQRAILRLLPYGVNYQTFIDEGFEEKTIKALFNELGLKSAQPPAAEPSPQTSPKPVSAAASQTSASDAAGPKPEERKDRIARLLALKKSKPTPVAPPSVTPTVEKTKADKTKSEKARLLQQKLDALKRQQAATQSPSHSSSSATSEKVLLSHPLPPQPPISVAPLADISANTNTLPLRDPKSTLPPRPVIAIGPQSSSTPSTPPVTAINGSRKRPVAADLNDFSSSGASSNPLKRPFGQTRQDSSLIIDVSEDSEDDENDSDDDDDVEIEVDSPEEQSPVKAMHTGGNRSRSGNSFRDVPPLSDPLSSFHQTSRPYGRPGTASMVTPPTGPAATRAKDDEYARKMRQIEEMKRKIAEAEAKKARNTPSGAQTPQTSRTGSSMPPETDAARRVMSAGDALHGAMAAAAAEITPEAVSARLPKRSDSVAASVSSHESRHEIRTRIASHQLPRVEATLQEKMFKLKLLQDKMAVLQTEIDAGMAEKMRLTDQISELEKDSEPEPESGSEPAAAEPAESEKHATITEQVVQASPAPEPMQVDVTEANPNEGKAEVTQEEESGSEYEPMEEVGAAEKIDEEEEEDIDDDDDDDEDDDEDENEDENEDEAEADKGSHQEPATAPLDANLVGRALSLDDGTPLTSRRVQQEQVQPSNRPAVAEPGPVPTPKLALDHYESPLKCFRSYRFHPQYKADVAGGLKSLTYSGRIDPDVELCPRELSGSGCAEQTCPFQHLSGMVPQDDQILVELGRSDDFTGEQKAQFVTGLRDVLKRFREKQVCDFDTIAYEIIAFRRQFLGDASKVVSHLEDVTV